MDEVRLASEMLWRTMNQAWVYLNVTLVTVFLYRQCKDISASFDSYSALFKWTKVYEWSSPGASNSSSNCEIKDAFIAASGSLSKCCWEWFLIAEARRMKTSVRNGTRCENKNTCLLTQCKVISCYICTESTFCSLQTEVCITQRVHKHFPCEITAFLMLFSSNAWKATPRKSFLFVTIVKWVSFSMD